MSEFTDILEHKVVNVGLMMMSEGEERRLPTRHPGIFVRIHGYEEIYVDITDQKLDPGKWFRVATSTFADYAWAVFKYLADAPAGVALMVYEDLRYNIND